MLHKRQQKMAAKFSTWFQTNTSIDEWSMILIEDHTLSLILDSSELCNRWSAIVDRNPQAAHYRMGQSCRVHQQWLAWSHQHLNDLDNKPKNTLWHDVRHLHKLPAYRVQNDLRNSTSRCTVTDQTGTTNLAKGRKITMNTQVMTKQTSLSLLDCQAADKDAVHTQMHLHQLALNEFILRWQTWQWQQNYFNCQSGNLPHGNHCETWNQDQESPLAASNEPWTKTLQHFQEMQFSKISDYKEFNRMNSKGGCYSVMLHSKCLKLYEYALHV